MDQPFECEHSWEKRGEDYVCTKCQAASPAWLAARIGGPNCICHQPMPELDDELKVLLKKIEADARSGGT